MYRHSSIAKSFDVVSVRLPAYLHIDQTDLCRISAMYPDSLDCGSYIVDFFDLSDAARYKARAVQMFMKMSQHTHVGAIVDPMPVEEMSFPPGLGQPEEILLPVRLEHIQTLFRPTPEAPKKKRNRLPKDQEVQIEGHEVQIKGLPPNLFTNDVISTMMEQAGLDMTVISIDTKTRAKQGVALITFASESAAGACVEHCNGRIWNSMGPPVVAHITFRDTAKSSWTSHFRAFDENAPAKVSMNTPQSINALPSYFRPDAPAYVHSVLTEYGLDEKVAANSDVSTTVSDSDVDDERRHGLLI